MFGAAQFPKFRENVYADSDAEIYMLPTAEVAITNMHRDEILDEGELAALLRWAYTLFPPREDERRTRYAGYQACASVREGRDVQVHHTGN